jgi:DNA-binding MarR family transcriptional regulator
VHDDGGPALFRLVRFWSRRWARGVAQEVGPDTSLPQNVLVVDTVDTLRRDGVAATVGELARQLGLDHSGASRMVTAAAQGGYLERRRSTTDRRRTVLELTPHGRALLDASLHWQQAQFSELVAHWDERDRAAFARYLIRLARELQA